MLKELKTESSNQISVIHNNEDSSNSSDSDSSTISKINKTFQDLHISRINYPRKPRFKNSIEKPLPIDIQPSNFNHNQFSVSSDKTYEWNIDNLSEQEILNKLHHMSMTANSYITNHNFTQSEIVDILATGFTECFILGGINTLPKKHDKKSNIQSVLIKMEIPFLMNTLAWLYQTQ